MNQATEELLVMAKLKGKIIDWGDLWNDLDDTYEEACRALEDEIDEVQKELETQYLSQFISNKVEEITEEAETEQEEQDSISMLFVCLDNDKTFRKVLEDKGIIEIYEELKNNTLADYGPEQEEQE